VKRPAPLAYVCLAALNLACMPPDEPELEGGSQSSTFGGVYTLQAVHSGKCADVEAGSTADGASVWQADCDSRASERWQLHDLGAETYEIRSAAGKCLDVSGASLIDGAKVLQWTCKQSPNQKWKLVSAGGGAFNLRAVHSNKCLEVAGASTATGATIQQWTCSTGSHQKWQVLPQNNAKLVVLAGGVTASADDGNVAANVVDGSLATRWSASGDGQWLRFDLGASRKLSFIKLAPFAGTSRSFKLDVQISLDGTTWTNAATGLVTPLTTTFATFDFPDVDTVRYVRILGHGNSTGAWNSYTEVELYGAVSPLAAAPPPSQPTAPAGEPPLPACKRTIPVTTSSALASAAGAAVAGDCIVLADGSYTFPVLKARGTAANPIVISAAHPLKATVSAGSLTYSGAAYLVVQGLSWQASSIKMDDCDHCRLTRSRLQLVEPATGFDWVTISGTSNFCRLDHNDLGPKTVIGNMVMLSGAGAQIVQNTRIDHNFFHDVLGGGGNGWETIRAGLSGWTFSSAKTIIEKNLFLHTTGDPETISVKSSDNIIRYNTMRASQGEFTLRHGNRTSVYGNFILGDGVAGSGGIRVLGGDHKLYDNYIEGVDGAGIFLEGGESDDNTGMLTDHKQVYRAQVVFNTIVNGRGISVGGAHPMEPIDCTVAYNVLRGTGGTVLSEAAGTVNTRYLGNIVSNGSTAIRGTDAVRLIDPKLVKVGEVWKLGSGSPAIDGASTMFGFVTEDFDGQPRVNPDVGADEVSSAGTTNGILGTADVGPASP
jgi:poly(beta-D-mannuronate) lyase